MQRLSAITHKKAGEILEKVNFFNRFNAEEKEILTGFTSHFFVAKRNEYIIHQGNHDTSFYIILSGKVSIRRDDSSSPLAALGPGDIFGEISFLTDRPRTTSAVATNQCIVFEIDRPTLKFMAISIREKLKDNIIQILVSRLDQMNRRYISAQVSP